MQAVLSNTLVLMLQRDCSLNRWYTGYQEAVLYYYYITLKLVLTDLQKKKKPQKKVGLFFPPKSEVLTLVCFYLAH